ncbi:MAG: DUF1569 domain-containing protein [Chitinophagaceae bacterium]|nr:DUF1569 domain-containing protein [Chitinophagaceae bacterium]
MEIKNLLHPDVKQEMIGRIERLKPEAQRLWGKMSVDQILAHAQAPFKIAYGELTIHAPFFMKWIMRFFKKTLFDDKPWQKGLPTLKQLKTDGNRYEFENVKKELISYISRFSVENIRITKHPVFGPLTTEQWGKMQWKHLDHHLRQFGV